MIRRIEMEQLIDWFSRRQREIILHLYIKRRKKPIDSYVKPIRKSDIKSMYSAQISRWNSTFE
jgi:hypothetical protein